MNINIQQERYSWIKPILKKKLTYNEVLKTCPHSKRSLERWVFNFKKYGWDGLEDKSTEPKTQKKEMNIEIKERIIALRKETGLCAYLKHNYFESCRSRLVIIMKYITRKMK